MDCFEYATLDRWGRYASMVASYKRDGWTNRDAHRFTSIELEHECGRAARNLAFGLACVACLEAMGGSNDFDWGTEVLCDAGLWRDGGGV